MPNSGWVQNLYNHLHTSCAGDAGGVPAEKPTWELMKCAKYGASQGVCCNDKSVFINSARRVCVAVELATGKQLWESAYPEPATENMCINSTTICVAPYVLIQETGAIVVDLSSEDHAFRSVDDVADEIYYIKTNAPQSYVLRIRGSDYDVLQIAAGAISVFDQGRRLLGLEAGAVVCYEIDSGKLSWSFQLPVSNSGRMFAISIAVYMLIGDRVFIHFNSDTLCCVDVNSGELVWKDGPDSVDEELLKTAPDRFLGCDDTLYLGRQYVDDGFLQARSSEDGRELWRVEARMGRMFLIAGDLLFGALDDVPVAWDRLTGEVVWRAQKKMTAVYHAVSAANKVIYTNTMSQMRCYEWETPYISPARK